jgi:hypothetical protein
LTTEPGEGCWEEPKFLGARYAEYSGLEMVAVRFFAKSCYAMRDV